MDTNNTALEQVSPPSIEIVDAQPTLTFATAADVKALNTVELVIEWLRDHHSHNYTEAFNALGVRRKQYYDSLRKPYVQQALMDSLKDKHRAELELIEASWLPVIHHQLQIANGQIGLPKDAVAAAKFLHEREEYLEKDLEAATTDDVIKSEASIMLERFKERYGDGKSTMRAKRTTVTEEISVQ